MVLDVILAAKSVAPAVLEKGLDGILQGYWDRKKGEAFDELMDAVRAGEVDVVDAAFEHDLAHALWKYFCAARDGAARRNLRLIARAIVGMLKDRKLVADEFDRYAQVLSRITYEQIVGLVNLAREHRLLADEVDQAKVNVETVKRARKAISQTLGIPEQEADGLFWELVAMGLALPMSGFGGNFHRPSALGLKLLELAALETP